MHGEITSTAEITNISRHGIWLIIDAEELLLPYTEFPWFRDATVNEICTIERPSKDHLRWPLLDVDLHISSIRHPQDYPLTSDPFPRS